MNDLQCFVQEEGLAFCCDEMPGLPNKIILDVINSVNVAQDHCRVQRDRSKLIDRIVDGVTGNGARRQQSINENHTAAIRACFDFSVGLAKSLTFTNYAIVDIHNKLREVHENIEYIAGELSELHDQLDAHIIWSSQKIAELDSRIQQGELERSAQAHVGNVFSKWEAGRLNAYSPLSQLFLVIDDLYWGGFGELCKRYPDSSVCRHLVSQAKNEISTNLKALNSVSFSGSVSEWMPDSCDVSPDQLCTLSFMGDWATKHEPFVQAASNPALPPPNGLPRVFDASLAKRRMWEQSMEKRVHEYWL